MPGDDPARSLSDILDELSRITGVQHGEAAAMRSAVGELSGALAQLFEMIRADRAQSKTTIAELEAALSEAHTRIRKLEAGEELAVPAPPPNDFGQLRDAAERLRQRTEQLFRDAGTPLDQANREAAARRTGAQGQVEDSIDDEPALSEADRAAQDARIEAARRAVEASLAEAEAESEAEAPEAEAEPEPARPGVLRVFPGSSAGAASGVAPPITVPEHVRAEVAVALAAPAPAQPRADDETQDTAAQDTSAEPADPAGPRRVMVGTGMPARPSDYPLPIAPRPARKRRGLRRRRVDARKLTGVDPTSALRAMVGAIDQLWTSGHAVDVVVALTDGGAIRIHGGDVRPLEVTEVEPGTAARSTITATSDQLIPIFGRLELTAAQSAPLIHGTRRDADLLVGWIDRAQRLAAEPL